MDDDGATAIAQSCNALTSLSLLDCEKINIEGFLRIVAASPCLRCLDISGENCESMITVDSAVLNEIALAQKSPQLLCTFGFCTVRSRLLSKGQKINWGASDFNDPTATPPVSVWR
jgi:hypothetical protein